MIWKKSSSQRGAAKGKVKNRGAKRSGRWVVYLGAVAIIGVFYYVISSPSFSVQEISFDQLNWLNEADIQRVSGITVDDNIFFLDAEAVERRLEALPYVKHCAVEKKFRYRKVYLRIDERRPIATVMVNNHLFEIDQDQFVLRELSPFSIHTDPMITNLPDLFALEIGKPIESVELGEALKLWGLFKALPFAKELTLSELSAESRDSLCMYFEELPYELRWGRADFEAQIENLAILWDEKNGFIPCDYYLDLRFENLLPCY